MLAAKPGAKIEAYRQFVMREDNKETMKGYEKRGDYLISTIQMSQEQTPYLMTPYL